MYIRDGAVSAKLALEVSLVDVVAQTADEEGFERVALDVRVLVWIVVVLIAFCGAICGSFEGFELLSVFLLQPGFGGLVVVVPLFFLYLLQEGSDAIDIVCATVSRCVIRGRQVAKSWPRGEQLQTKTISEDSIFKSMVIVWCCKIETGEEQHIQLGGELVRHGGRRRGRGQAATTTTTEISRIALLRLHANNRDINCRMSRCVVSR